MLVRSVTNNDYYEILDLYTEFTNEEYRVSKEQFENFMDTTLTINHRLYVIEDFEGRVVGCATLLIEHKLIHNQSKVAHIEDVIINSKHRGLGYGKVLIKSLITKAMEEDCYKVILDCEDDIRPFYESCGLSEKGIQMALYF